MVRLVPRYLERLDPKLDRTRRLFERLGISPEEIDSSRGASLAVRVTTPSYSRLLAARHLVDLLLRLQPLVSDVYVDESLIAEVGTLHMRFPFEETTGAPGDALSIVVGKGSTTSDLVFDAAGWTGTIGSDCPADDDENPLGALAFAELAAGEAFKLAFKATYPDRPLARRFLKAFGPFSFWDYSATSVSPQLPRIDLNAVLVGVGGVGAGAITAIAELRSKVAGRLALVDPDRLDIYNMNRTLYATVDEADAAAWKVASAADYLRACSKLEVTQVAQPYRQFARTIPRRSDRRFPLVITGLDKDDIRWEVQRDLPKVLIDGATGSQANCRIERIRFGEPGCIGCSRPPQSARALDPNECDVPPDPVAPSISFLSAFAGTLCAVEAVKASMGLDGLRGYFEHSFIYGLNPEATGIPARRSDCAVNCSDRAVIEAFRAKWPNDNGDPRRD